MKDLSSQPYLRRNFWMHCLEGGLYMAGTAFLGPETVLPTMVKSLGGSNQLIALMPVLLPAAYALPGVFVAPMVERLHRLKPFVVFFGILQRLPYLLTGLVILLAPQASAAILTLVVLTPVISGVVGGVGVNAWMEWVTRLIPQELRASGWATRYLIQGTIGLAAGPVIHWVFTHRPGAEGYALLHLICFGFLALSLTSQLCIREQPTASAVSTPRPPFRYGRYLSALPAMLKSQPLLIRLVVARFTGMGYLMLAGFMGIHVLGVTDRPQAAMGHLMLASMIGALFGNGFAGWLGNRHGGKVLMLLSRCLCLGICLVLPFLNTFTAFLALYFIWGFGLFVDKVGDLTFSAELCPFVNRPTYQAMLAFFQMISLLGSVSLGGWVYTLSGSFHVLTVLSGLFATISILVLHTIPEVRKKHLPPVMGENPPMG
ncbi:MAG: MFS transporter [Verrucomicrobium sp.]